ncbi:MAG: high-affinity nickel-transport family protein [Candidatus Acidiferrales bacterium]
MISPLAIIALGFFLGMRHATDPDHVIAVTTIVARHRKIRVAAFIGAFWGVGHSLTILGVGGGIILLGWVIPARLGLSMEFSVGLMLILLGILNLTGMLRWISETFTSGGKFDIRFHERPDSHGEYIHTHVHSHNSESPSHDPERSPLSWLDRHLGRLGIYQAARPLVVGIVHGLAGSAAVALLVLAAIPKAAWAVGYLLIFGIGTIAGMMLITGAIALPFAYSEKISLKMNRWLRVASGLISLGFGLFLAYQFGFVHGLFTGHPQWQPR